MNKTEQEFLNALDTKLWKAADKLRNSIDAANYKHVVLGLIFLKYVSDSFEERQNELRHLFTVDNSDDNIYFMPREDYDSDEEYNKSVNTELELREYYTAENVFWVPQHARWKYLQATAALPIGSVLWQKEPLAGEEKGQDVKLRSISWLVDNALEQIEKENKKLKGVLNRISQHQVFLNNLVLDCRISIITNNKYLYLGLIN